MSKTYIKRMINMRTIAALLLTLLVFTNCERRELWVYGDQFHSLRLDVDWRKYQEYDPQGMTTYFFPDDPSIGTKFFTTPNVRSLSCYLSAGGYKGVVFDYSPSEYTHQEFVGMDEASTAEVRLTPAPYQPDSMAELFGRECYYRELPTIQPSGLFTVMNEPQEMALDTVNMQVYNGKYNDYVPYKERETYQATLVEQVYNAEPEPLVWKMRIRIFISGIYYLSEVKASIAGLADGHYLARHENTDVPCLLELDNWQTQVTGDNVGYIATTFNTFGLRTDAKTRATLTTGYLPQGLRLNLRFLLRDRSTVLYYHFDLGDHVAIYDDQLVLRIDLGDDFTDHPDLPYVEAHEGTGFGGVVVPWVDGPHVDVEF
jgi:hypothetical protein